MVVDARDWYVPPAERNGFHAESPILDPSTGRPFHSEPPNPDEPYDNMALPHVVTFQTIFGSAYRTYVHERWDEAMRNDRDAGRAMRRDAFLMSLLQERVLSTSSLKWHLEVDNAQDYNQKMVKDGMTLIVRRTPRLRRMMRMLLQALWFGRYGVQVKWQWAHVPGAAEKCLTVQKHLPVNGDKIGHKFDGTPYVLIHGGESNTLPGAEITYTTVAKALVLRGSWRERFLIHYADPFDEDFFTVDQQEAIHGVGLRSILYFMDWLRKEYIGWYIDTLERTGLGFLVWRYPAGNKAAKDEAMREARKHSRRTNLVLPYYETASGRSPGVEHTETPVAGIELVLELQKHIEEHQERLVTGQSLSTQDKATSGAEVADLRAATKAKLTQADSDELAETLTGSEDQPGLLNVIKRWTYPWADFPVRWVFDVDSLEPAKKLESVERAFSMGASFAEDDVRALTGLPTPQPGQKMLNQQQMQQQGMPGEEQGVPGMSGDEGGEQGGQSGGTDWKIIHGPRGGRWMRNPKTGEVRHADLKQISNSHLPKSHTSRKNENFQRAEEPIQYARLATCDRCGTVLTSDETRVWCPAPGCRNGVAFKYQAEESTAEAAPGTHMNGESLAAETARLWNERKELPSEHEMHLIGGFLAPLDWVVWYNHETHQWDYCHADEWHGTEPEQYAYSAAQARAPKGGVTIGGKFYRGGQWIPKNAGEVTTSDFETDQELQPSSPEEHGQLKPKRTKADKGQVGGENPPPAQLPGQEGGRDGDDLDFGEEDAAAKAMEEEQGNPSDIASRITRYTQGPGKKKVEALQKMAGVQSSYRKAVEHAIYAWGDANDALKRFMELRGGKRKTAKWKGELETLTNNLNEKVRVLEAARLEKHKAVTEQRQAVDAALVIPNNTPIHASIRQGDFDEKTTSEIDEGFRVVSSWTKDVSKLRVEVVNDPSRNGRAAYQPSLNRIAGVPNMGPVSTVHELGHAIEDQLDVYDLCKEFLQYRVGDEQPKSLNKVLEEKYGMKEQYGADEVGRKNHFDRFFSMGASAYYVGKSYNGATEILSMGMEALYADGPTFAAKDPEYAAFILGILDGSLRGEAKERDDMISLEAP